jgi:hypothetical protein
MNHLNRCVATLFLLVAGCISAISPAEMNQDPVALDQLAPQFANELCDAFAPCCEAAQVAYDATTCKNTASEVYGFYVNESAVSNTTYDAAAARACLNNLKSVLGGCGALLRGAGGAACDNVFHGTLPAGGECEGVCRGAARTETCMGDFYNVPGKY